MHTFPFMMFSEASFAAISLGGGQHFLEEVSAILEENKKAWQEGSHNRYVFLKDQLTTEKSRWKTGNDIFHEAIRSSWKQHLQGEELSEAVK